METRGRFIKVRLSATERVALDRVLAQEQRRTGEVVRELIREEARRRCLWPVAPQPAADEQQPGREVQHG